jgi:hypothetical protein
MLGFSCERPWAQMRERFAKILAQRSRDEWVAAAI